MEKKNKIFKILIIFVAVFALLTGGYFGYKAFTGYGKGKTETKEKKSSITPVLFEVTKEGSDNKIYLFGSIHAAKTKDLVFPDYILKAYNDSHYIACEFDILAYEEDAMKVLSDTLKMQYLDDTTLSDHLSPETYKKLIDFLKKYDSYSEKFEDYKPEVFATLVEQLIAENAGLNLDSGIDKYFLKKAKKDKKTILEVESADFQSGLTANFSDEVYDFLLSETIDNYDEGVKEIRKIYDTWKQGKVEDLVGIVNGDSETDDNYTEEQIAMITEYNKKMADDRNVGMTEKLIEYFNNNHDVFFMVGTAHVLGDKGIAKQLEEKGYTVKQIK